MKVYIVIIEDRHHNTGLYPFMYKEKAMKFAETEVIRRCNAADSLPAPEKLIIHEPYIYSARYSPNGDTVSVAECEVVE